MSEHSVVDLRSEIWVYACLLAKKYNSEPSSCKNALVIGLLPEKATLLVAVRTVSWIPAGHQGIHMIVLQNFTLNLKGSFWYYISVAFVPKFTICFTCCRDRYVLEMCKFFRTHDACPIQCYRFRGILALDR